jgi:hypothetical protein
MAFRYLDGGYIDNTNAAFTLASMQAECASSSSSGSDIGGTGTVKEGGQQLDCSSNTYKMIISGNSPQQSLWLDPLFPPGSFIQPLSPNVPGANSPIPTIFAESFPGKGAWTAYATADIRSSNTSYFWHGRLTTVSNQWYGVTEGATVELLYFTGDDTPIDVPGIHAAGIFAEVYAPSAVAQAEGAAPIIKAFIEGSLP